MRRFAFLAILTAAACSSAPPPRPTELPTPVYVVLWFDTEDYLLLADDDATLRNATFLTGEGLKATFKVVGEKARVLEQRGRSDVIAALKKHEIGFHSNLHSVHPTPAQYLSALGWDEGIAEFERREGPGLDDVRRIFGVNPSCYGQPGSSWGPQAFGAMKKWGMKAYLDTGSHLGIEGKPHYYCGLLTMYDLTHTLRTNLGGDKDLEIAMEKFRKSHEQLVKEGGGLVSIFYHPCEFVHKRFWDAIFKDGVNPPREQWTPPPQKTPEESKVAFETFEAWIRYIKTFPGVKFITASEAARVYRDRAQEFPYFDTDLRRLASDSGDEVKYLTVPNHRMGDTVLSAGEILGMMNQYVANHVQNPKPDPVQVFGAQALYGPDRPGPTVEKPFSVDWSQFSRTVLDVQRYLDHHHRIPSTVWLGSTGVPPESYYTALARVVIEIHDRKTPTAVEIRPAKFTAGARVADDSPRIFGWLFPAGFHAPEMMALARRQAWTIKPAILSRGP
jgi:hypothetical protein